MRIMFDSFLYFLFYLFNTERQYVETQTPNPYIIFPFSFLIETSQDFNSSLSPIDNNLKEKMSESFEIKINPLVEKYFNTHSKLKLK